jgi:hypothetical protein
MTMKIIETPGIREQLAGEKPEYVRFYEAWKRIVAANGWEKLGELLIDDAPSASDGNPRNRVSTVAVLQGPAFYESFRVNYNAEDDERIRVLDVGTRLRIDHIRD